MGTEKLVKGGGNWVDADRFFDRDAEIEALEERFHEGGHTLLTAQRRMGKTSLVREVQRRLRARGEAETLFVDLEGAQAPADAIAEFGSQMAAIGGLATRLRATFSNALQGLGSRLEEVQLPEFKVKLRAGVDPGNWQRKGDEIFAALAAHDKRVSLAIDEFPILVNRLLQGHDYTVTPERRRAVDDLLSWLRRNGQDHRGRVSIIVSGSVGLEPILRQAGLSAQANIFPAFELRPWSASTAAQCLEALARQYDLEIPAQACAAVCTRLGCCIPHHVQLFFAHLHEELRRDGRKHATVDDVTRVYENDMLSVRGQIDLDHYENRLKHVLGIERYAIALEILTEAAVSGGRIEHEVIEVHRRNLAEREPSAPTDLREILYVLEHDGYLAPQGSGYEFVSTLLRDWWQARHGRFHNPLSAR